MTAASELKSAAVVETEVKRKTSETRTVSVVSSLVSSIASKAAVNEVSAVSFNQGSTTAAATKSVASAQAENVTALVKTEAEVETGSRAASTFKAASIRATRLPVSIFSQIPRLSANPYRIQYPLWQIAPEGLCAQVAPAK